MTDYGYMIDLTYDNKPNGGTVHTHDYTTTVICILSFT